MWSPPTPQSAALTESPAQHKSEALVRIGPALDLAERRRSVVVVDGSVVVSGDTRFSENLIAKASGADLLTHQVAAAREALLAVPAFKVVLDHHTKPEEAGVVFSRVKPKLAVFYHFVLLGSPAVPAVT